MMCVFANVHTHHGMCVWSQRTTLLVQFSPFTMGSWDPAQIIRFVHQMLSSIESRHPPARVLLCKNLFQGVSMCMCICVHVYACMHIQVIQCTFYFAVRLSPYSTDGLSLIFVGTLILYAASVFHLVFTRYRRPFVSNCSLFSLFIFAFVEYYPLL